MLEIKQIMQAYDSIGYRYYRCIGNSMKSFYNPQHVGRYLINTIKNGQTTEETVTASSPVLYLQSTTSIRIYIVPLLFYNTYLPTRFNNNIMPSLSRTTHSHCCQRLSGDDNVPSPHPRSLLQLIRVCNDKSR